MKKNNILPVICLAAAVLTAPACEDILDKSPLDTYTDKQVMSDAALLDAFIATQYLYTPVLCGDATTLMNSWQGTGSPMNKDSRSGNSDYFMDNSTQFFGPTLTLDIADETRYMADKRAGGIYSPFKFFGITQSGGMLEYWENAYYTLRNLNGILASLPESPLSADLVTLRTGEARFLRAFIYFSMVKRYGGVPLLTVVPELDSPKEILYPKRNSEQEIYDFIISEMDLAKVELEKSPGYSRADKWAALCLQARAALYAGSIAKYGKVQLDGLLGIPSDQANKYFQKCYDACEEIMTQGPFSLYRGNPDKVQNFKDIFLVEHNCEVIMAKVHEGKGFNAGGRTTWSWDTIEAPEPQVWGTGNMNAPYLEMAEEFEMVDGTPGTLDRALVASKTWTMEELWGGRDPRFYASIWTNGTPWRDAVSYTFGAQYSGGKMTRQGSDIIDMHWGIRPDNGTETIYQADLSYQGMPAVGKQIDHHARSGLQNPGFGIMKYVDPSADNMVWLAESRTDYIIFRYAEVLLNMAEASFELGKGDAMSLINELRDRAGIEPLKSVDLDKIKHERKVELAFENHRYWDLRRWRDAETALTRSFTGIRYVYDWASKEFLIEFIPNIDGQNQPTFPERCYYFPITLARTSANPSLVENPGY